MSIASELTALNTAKTNIKSAIEAKGVSLSGVPFTNYHAKIAEIEGGGELPTTNNYVRPPDWLALPTITEGEQKVAALVAVMEGGTNTVFIMFMYNCTVDWGDGTVENLSGNLGTPRTHTYTYSSLSEATYCSRGYRQAIITITPQSGYNITMLQFGFQGYPERARFLDIRMSTPYLTSLTFSSCEVLEQFESMGINGITSFENKFNGCASLKSIVSLYTGAATTFASMFQYCYMLEKIPMLDSHLVTTLASCFSDCYKLVEIPELDTSKVTNWTNTFRNCYSLEKLPALNVIAGTSFSNSFLNATNITRIPFTNIGATFTVSSKRLSVAAIVEIFNNLKAVGTSTSCAVSNNYGYAYLTTAQRAIATGKGWTIS